MREALSLPPLEKAELIDKLLASLDRPDRELGALWATEVESRIDAYERGDLKSVSLNEVLEKYGQ